MFSSSINKINKTLSKRMSNIYLKFIVCSYHVTYGLFRVNLRSVVA